MDFIDGVSLLKNVRKLNEKAAALNEERAADLQLTLAQLRHDIGACAEHLQKLQSERGSEEYMSVKARKAGLEEQYAAMLFRSSFEGELAAVDEAISAAKALAQEKDAASLAQTSALAKTIAIQHARRKPRVAHTTSWTVERKPKNTLGRLPAGLGPTVESKSPEFHPEVPWHDARAHDDMLEKSARSGLTTTKRASSISRAQTVGTFRSRSATLNVSRSTDKLGNTSNIHDILASSRCATDKHGATVIGSDVFIPPELYATLSEAERKKPLHPSHLLGYHVDHPHAWRRLPPVSTHKSFDVPPPAMPTSDLEHRRLRIAADADRAHYYPRRDGKPSWKETKNSSSKFFSRPLDNASWWIAESKRRAEALEARFAAANAVNDEDSEDEEPVDPADSLSDGYGSGGDGHA